MHFLSSSFFSPSYHPFLHFSEGYLRSQVQYSTQSTACFFCRRVRAYWHKTNKSEHFSMPSDRLLHAKKRELSSRPCHIFDGHPKCQIADSKRAKSPIKITPNDRSKSRQIADWLSITAFPLEFECLRELGFRFFFFFFLFF